MIVTVRHQRRTAFLQGVVSGYILFVAIALKQKTKKSSRDEQCGCPALNHGAQVDIARQPGRVPVLSATPPPYARKHTLTPTFPEDRDPRPDSHQSGAPTPSKLTHHSNSYLHSLGVLIMGRNTRPSAPILEFAPRTRTFEGIGFEMQCSRPGSAMQ